MFIVYFMIIIVIISVAVQLWLLIRIMQPTKKIILKYGLPLKHILGYRTIYSLPMRSKYCNLNNLIDIDIFKDFIIISYNKNELKLNKDFKSFSINSSSIDSVFEIKNNDNNFGIIISDKENLGILIKNNEAKFIKEWFESK